MDSAWNPLQTMMTTTQPHIIIVGVAGCGKSTATRTFLGSSIALWLRCSQDPSLRADNRERIKMAARRRAQDVVHWIVLEHADLLHSDAQAFLRRVIETSTGSARFVLEARNLSAISEPLLSRMSLFNAPTLLPYEIRAQIMKVAPTMPVEVATRIAEQAEGNVRWATLQGQGGGDGFCDGSLVEQLKGSKDKSKWQEVLRIMEFIQQSGSNPRAFVGGKGWDRPGGVCPWALTAKKIAESI